MAGKQNKNLITFGLLGLGAIFYFARTAKTIDDLNYDFRAFKIKQFAFPITQAQGTLAINNPNTQKLNFSSLFLNLSYQGEIIGTVKLNNKQTIKGRSESYITFPIDIRVAPLVNKIFDLAVLRRLDGVQLQGTIYLNGVSYPVSTKIDLS